MKLVLISIFILLTFSACIFQPPVTVVDNRVEIHQETELAPDVADLNMQDLLVDDKIEKLLSLAHAQMGTPYLYGGSDYFGFDCSGFVYYIYKNAVGKNLPRTSLAQSQFVDPLGRHELAPGDIVFFDTAKKGYINHCGIYMGNGKFIHSSSGKVKAVTISNLDRGFYKKNFRWGGRVN